MTEQYRVVDNVSRVIHVLTSGGEIVAAATRLTCRTRDEFLSIVNSYLMNTGLSGTRLSSLALGDGGFLSRVERNEKFRLPLESVDRVLSYIESNGGVRRVR